MFTHDLQNVAKAEVDDVLNALEILNIRGHHGGADLVGDAFLLREVDMVQVVGREQAVRIYELLATAGTSLPSEQEKAFASYAAGLEAYRQQYWDEALGLFRESLTLWQQDGPSRIMLERCLLYQEAPPPEDWDGVYEATKK